MLKKITNIFFRNAIWKISSLLLALIMWFLIINTANPFDTRSFTLPLEIANRDTLLAQNAVLLNETTLLSRSISVRVRARRTDLDRLSQNRRNMFAVLDLAQFNDLDITEPESLFGEVEVLFPNFGDVYEVVSQLPTLEVMLDALYSIEKTIKLETEGDLADGHIVSGMQIEPRIVQIRGAKSLLDTISAAIVQVDLTNISENIETALIPILLDENADPITSNGLVSFQPSLVSVSINVNQSKTVPISITTQGTPADGYIVGEIIFEPVVIEIIGSPTNLLNITEISLPPIDVTDDASMRNLSFDIADFLPPGIMLKDDDSTEVFVTVNFTRR